jgi:hypothetical protein
MIEKFLEGKVGSNCHILRKLKFEEAYLSMSAIVAFGSKLKDFIQRIAGFVKKASPTVKKVLKNPLVQQALNAFGKWITKDKNSHWGDNVNKTTRMVEDSYNTFTKQMEKPEEPPSRIDATKNQTMEIYFPNNLNGLSSLVKKKNPNK